MCTDDPADSKERLLRGVRRFQRDIYPSRRAAYEQAAREGQSPHALFITCADSRIDPEMITQSGPGEIFVSRNIGNFVPAYDEASDGVSAIIEYAVSILRVSHIVTCGHSQCGAMTALLHPENLGALPRMKHWLRNGEPASRDLEGRFPLSEEHLILERLVEENVLLQMDHLHTYPCVKERITQGGLALSGWVYDIGSGGLRAYDDGKGKFLAITPNDQVASAGAIGWS